MLLPVTSSRYYKFIINVLCSRTEPFLYSLFLANFPSSLRNDHLEPGLAHVRPRERPVQDPVCQYLRNWTVSPMKVDWSVLSKAKRNNDQRKFPTNEIFMNVIMTEQRSSVSFNFEVTEVIFAYSLTSHLLVPLEQ